MGLRVDTVRGRFTITLCFFLYCCPRFPLCFNAFVSYISLLFYLMNFFTIFFMQNSTFFNIIFIFWLGLPGWHICSKCQKSASYMCYTCTYSLCKICVNEAEFTCIRGKKGFCPSCMGAILLMETSENADEKVGTLIFLNAQFH